MEFVAEDRPEHTRQLAGLCLKNMIAGHQQSIVDTKINRWMSVDFTVREAARQAFFHALVSPVKSVSHTAASVIAAYAQVDLVKGEWDTVLPQLVGYCMNAECPEPVKVSCLECLGYICESLDEDVLIPEQTNKILTAIVSSMADEMPNTIRAVAADAMYNSLGFCEKNFETEAERNMIMSSIRGAMGSNDNVVRSNAYKCIEAVAEIYYRYLPPYIEELYKLTIATIQDDEEEIAMRAVEFWSAISRAETEAFSDGEEHHRIMEKVVQTGGTGGLIAIILSKFATQADTPEEEDDNLCTSCHRFLNAATECVGNGVATAVMPTILQNINSENWRLKDASLNAFANILDGPSEDFIQPMVTQAMETIIHHTQDPHDMVVCSALWAVSQVCVYHKAAIPTPSIAVMVTAIMTSLDRPSQKVQYLALNAMLELAEACEDYKDDQNNLLSFFFSEAVTKILTVAAKSTVGDGNEQLYKDNIFTAYETLNRMIENSAIDMQPIVQKILYEGVARLEATLTPGYNLSGSNKQHLQGFLASLVGQCVQKLPASEAAIPPELSDRIMKSLLTIATEENNTALSDVFMTMGYMVDNMETNYERYHDHMMPILISMLDKHDDHNTLVFVIGVIGDACRIASTYNPSKGYLIMKVADEIMHKLLALLQSPTVSAVVKPYTISFFADIALCLSEQFERYAPSVLIVLHKACESAQFSEDNEEHNEFVFKIRESILEAYTGIVQGLGEKNKLDCVREHCSNIIEFAVSCGTNKPAGEEVPQDLLKAAIGVLGDMGHKFGAKINSYINQGAQQVIAAGQASHDEDVKTTAKWAKKMLGKS